MYARVPGARFIAVTPEGNLLVSNPGAGKVSLVRAGTAGGDPVVSDWVTGLRKPHDLVFHAIGGTLWLYVSESNGVRRYAWTGAAVAPTAEVVLTGLPDSSTPELHGSYGHELKNIALDVSDRLYVSIASTLQRLHQRRRGRPGAWRHLRVQRRRRERPAVRARPAQRRGPGHSSPGPTTSGWP